MMPEAFDPDAFEPTGRRFRRRRRRRREGQPRRGLYLLPHLVTTAGLFFGFWSIAHSFHARYDLAALGIVLAAICDTIDGRVARLARATSRFGMEYDSIVDMVCFGVAPAFLAYTAGQLHELGRAGFVMAFLFMACVALRLARFNVAPSRYKGRFEGMPSPAGAGMVAATQWFVSFLREHDVRVDVPESAVAGGVAVLGFLMVSAIPYRSFKELDLRHGFRTLVFVVFAIALVVQEPSVTLFCLGLVYVVSGPAEWLYRRITKQPLQKISDPAESHALPGVQG
jgi:CDP-diacylglycerol--serine O-phosphatidyltransferase